MAVSIMSACCRASVLGLCLLGCFLQVQGEVFQALRDQNVFLRSKRANRFLVEEILQGDLERECHEELCSYEEAREFFENIPETNKFWSTYYGAKHCRSNPCLHGGNCINTVNGFRCSCIAPYHGRVCELGGGLELHKASQEKPLHYLVKPEFCPTDGPTACQQLCTSSALNFSCSCMQGFKLQSDRRSCLPEVDFPCGILPDNLNTLTPICHHGNCPWQVSVTNSRGEELCGGVLLDRFSVLTAASCLLLNSNREPNNFYVVPGNEKRSVAVRAINVHERFRSDQHDNNLALLELTCPLTYSPTLIHLCLPTRDFSENILMHSGRRGITKGVREIQEVVYMTLDECRNNLKISHPLSNKMFCMKQKRAARQQSGPAGTQSGGHGRANRNRHETENENPGKPNGRPNGVKVKNHETSGADRGPMSDTRQCGHLLPGTPVATVDQGTVFLTGLLISSSADCDGGGLVFSKLSRYLAWIKPLLKDVEVRAPSRTEACRSAE